MPTNLLITEICWTLNNFFAPIGKRADMSYIHRGTFTIENGSVSGMDFIKENQYFRIVGSAFNDGVYKNAPDELSELQDENFKGAVWEMAVPREFLALCDDIQEYRTKTNELKTSDKGFQSESFGGYSYSLSGSVPAYMQAWEKRINSGLNSYRRLSAL